MMGSNTVAVCPPSTPYSALAVPFAALARQFMPVRYPLTIAEHRKRRGLSQNKLAERLGVEQPTVQRWEAGKRTPDAAQIGEIADALGVTPGDLFKMPEFMPAGPTLFVKGEVAAGVWREAYELDQSEWTTFTGRSDVTADVSMRFGLRIVGESMNLLYPHGSIVECVSVFDTAEIEPGKRVVVLRRRDDYEYEATVKEFVVHKDGSRWLVARTTAPGFDDIPLDKAQPGILETVIRAVVVGVYRPEP